MSRPDKFFLVLPNALLEEGRKAFGDTVDVRGIEKLPTGAGWNCERHGQIVQNGCPACRRALVRVGARKPLKRKRTGKSGESVR